MKIINTLSLDKTRKEIQELKKQKKQVIVLAQDDEFNRKILEIKDVDILLSPELHDRKDKLKQRDSGLNEVLCKIASKNNIKIGLEINKIRKTKDKNRAIILARIMQNIKLCKKAGTELVLLGKYNKKDAFSLLLTLGCSTSQAKKAIEA